MPPNSRIPREKSLMLTRCFKSNCWLLQTHQVFNSLFPLTQSVMVPLALYHLLYSTRVTYGNPCFSIGHPMLSNHFPKEAQYTIGCKYPENFIFYRDSSNALVLISFLASFSEKFLERYGLYSFNFSLFFFIVCFYIFFIIK